MRGQFEIMSEILELCLLPMTQTAIRCKTSLNHAQIKTYLVLLMSHGMLEHDSGKYTTTLRGRSFLDAVTQLNEALEHYTQTLSTGVALGLQGRSRGSSKKQTGSLGPN